MPFNISVRVDDSKFRQKMNDVQRMTTEMKTRVKRELMDFAFETYREQIPIAEPTPSRPNVGMMRDAVYVKETRDGFIVSTTDPAAKYVAYGTRPHPIIPTGKPLRFWWKLIGGWVTSWQGVMHPGQRRNPFHARTARLVKLQIPKIVNRVLDATVRQVG